MIFEFALEPALVASWHDRQAFRFFDGKFGIGTKRAPCTYPAKWKKLVMDEFHALFAGSIDKAAKQAAKKRIDILIRHLEEGATKRQQRWKPADSWLTCALAEHSRRPFQGIVVSEASEDSPAAVLRANSLSENDERWNPIARVTPRTAAELCSDFGPLLAHAQDLRLVDPFMDSARDKWRVVMGRIITLVQKNRDGDTAVRIELHASIDHLYKDGRLQDSLSELEDAQTLVDAARESFQGLLTGSTKLEVLIWSGRNHPGASGDRFHNRYVLSETGGLMLGHGLDAPGHGNDDITLLSKPQWKYRRSIYCKTGNALRMILASAIEATGAH